MLWSLCSNRLTQQNKLRVGEDEGKTERLSYNVPTFPFKYVNIQSKCSGKWSFQDNSMSLHDNDIIPRYRCDGPFSWFCLACVLHMFGDTNRKQAAANPYQPLVD